MSCGVGGRCGLNLALLWCRLAVVAPIGPLAWDPPDAAGAALEKQKEVRLYQLLEGTRSTRAVLFGDAVAWRLTRVMGRDSRGSWLSCFPAFCSRIACVSAPSVYRTLRRLHRARCSACLFEHDRRFAGLGEEFVFYDYRRPLDFPPGVEAHSFDLVIADPPYLSQECLRKTAQTIQYLTRGKILLCTGRANPNPDPTPTARPVPTPAWVPACQGC